MKSNNTLRFRNLIVLLTLSFFLFSITSCCLVSKKEVCTLNPKNNTEPFRTTYNTPKNLAFVKQGLNAYYNSGGYEAGLNQVGNEAMKYLIQCKDTPGKLAIVFDIDETSLSNHKYDKKMDYGYNSALWNKWIESGGPVAIKPSLALFNQAKKQGIAIFFITGGKDNLHKY